MNIQLYRQNYHLVILVAIIINLLALMVLLIPLPIGIKQYLPEWPLLVCVYYVMRFSEKISPLYLFCIAALSTYIKNYPYLGVGIGTYMLGFVVLGFIYYRFRQYTRIQQAVFVAVLHFLILIMQQIPLYQTLSWQTFGFLLGQSCVALLVWLLIPTDKKNFH